MRSQRSFRTAICTEYEHLLFACQRAFQNLQRRREQVAAVGFADDVTSDELRRLELAYIRAYAHLESHDEHCQLCRLVAKLGARNFSGSNAAVMEKKSFA